MLERIIGGFFEHIRRRPSIPFTFLGSQLINTVSGVTKVLVLLLGSLCSGVCHIGDICSVLSVDHMG